MNDSRPLDLLPNTEVRERATIRIAQWVAFVSLMIIFFQNAFLSIDWAGALLVANIGVLMLEGVALLLSVIALVVFRTNYGRSKRLTLVSTTLTLFHSSVLWANATATNTVSLVVVVMTYVVFNDQERSERRFWILSFLAIFLFSEFNSRMFVKDLHYYMFHVSFDDYSANFEVAYIINTVIATLALIGILRVFIKNTHDLEQGMAVANRRVDSLLRNAFPDVVVDRFYNFQRTNEIFWEHQEVVVLFSDLTNFTRSISNMSPKSVLDELNTIYREFDYRVAKYGLTKIKTIGDGYLAVCGAPIDVDDKIGRTIRFARDAVEFVERYRNTSVITGLNVRIGIDIGPAISGVIGNLRQAYDVWGNTVNKASRLESTGVPGRIQVSSRIHDLASSEFVFERTSVDLKGIGRETTYLLI